MRAPADRPETKTLTPLKTDMTALLKKAEKKPK